MTIGKKLHLTLGVTILALLAVGILGLVNLGQVKSLEEGIYAENLVALENLNGASQDYLKMRIVIRDLVLAVDDSRALALRKQLYALDESFRGHMKAYRAAAGTDAQATDSEELSGFQAAYEAYQKILEDLFTLVQAGKRGDAVDRMYGDGADRAQEMTAHMEGLLQSNKQAVDARFRTSLEVVTAANWTTVVLLTLATVFSLAAASFLSRSIVGPLVQSAALARRLSEGDLTVRAADRNVRRKDEVGTLAQSLDALALGLFDFVQSLKQTGSDIDRSARDLDERASRASEASLRIADATRTGHGLAQDQAAGVTETTATVAQIAATIEKFDRLIEDQSASITQTSASLEEMASNIRSLSARASQLGQAFGGLKASSDDGRDKLFAMVAKIETIASQSARLADANNTIKTIASQTSLLSMNAAIEAAHAGSAGAGFAVVADEIRKLAEAATQRSKDISREVKEIQALIAQTSQDSETAKRSFGIVLERVDELGYFEGEMTNALAEQDAGAQQILEATSQVSATTAEVRQGSSEILEGSLAIRREMEHLLDHSRRLEASLEAVTADGTAIAAASEGVREDSVRNKEMALRLDEIVAVFQV